jgi:hypothetical protein
MQYDELRALSRFRALWFTQYFFNYKYYITLFVIVNTLFEIFQKYFKFNRILYLLF